MIGCYIFHTVSIKPKQYKAKNVSRYIIGWCQIKVLTACADLW